jgi:hypothetical protein
VKRFLRTQVQWWYFCCGWVHGAKAAEEIPMDITAVNKMLVKRQIRITLACSIVYHGIGYHFFQRG